MSEQQEFHGYDSLGGYRGLIIATPEQLAEMGLVSGDAPAPDMTALQANAVAQIKARHAEMLGKLTGGYSAEERDTWSMQLEWARGYLADQNAPHGVLLSGMVPMDMVTTLANDAQMMADKIVGKANAFAKLTMIANRMKTEAIAAIDVTTTPGQLAETMTALVDAETVAIAEFQK